MDCSPDGSVGSYTSLHISPAQGTWRQRPDERSRSLFIGQRSLDWPHTKDLGKKKQNRTYSFLPNPANAPIWTTPNHVESRLRLPPVRGPVRGRAGPRFFFPQNQTREPHDATMVGKTGSSSSSTSSASSSDLSLLSARAVGQSPHVPTGTALRCFELLPLRFLLCC